MSPSRRRLNCVAPSSSARCGSSSSVRSGKVASQREIKSGLAIGDTPVHPPPRPEDRDGSKSPKEGDPGAAGPCRYGMGTGAKEAIKMPLRPSDNPGSKKGCYPRPTGRLDAEAREPLITF